MVRAADDKTLGIRKKSSPKIRIEGKLTYEITIFFVLKS